METLHDNQTLLEKRKCVCESLDWTPTEENPLPPGIIEIDSTGVPELEEVTYVPSIPAFLNAKISWFSPQSSDFERSFHNCNETSVIDAIHGMAEWHSCQLYMAIHPPTNTIGHIFERDDGSPQSWMNPGYMGVFRYFLPRILECNYEYDEPLNAPLEQRHRDILQTYKLGHTPETTGETRDETSTHNADIHPYSASALAHDNGTRQEIVDYSSDYEEFEFDTDDEYPMEEPLTEKEIKTRGQCSEILQILEGVMSEGGQVNEGQYLKMCNILKDVYNK